jgi:alkanesulfonate monooxygenase SsuD/methylene tetrahydromethanopterin reductase-like flavin-dependent oxidoreductase (luciferase family)
MSEITFWYHLPVKEGVGHTMDCAEKAERAGFQVVSHMDHFLYLSKDRGCIPECWTMLTAIAARTGLTVSPLVMCSLFRNPALVAKMVATLDQLTEGRVYLGLGAGWWQEEFEAYGYRWLPPGKRVSRTIEAARIIKRMWTEEKLDFQGRFWSLKDCALSPRPYTDPHPLLWNGGGGPRMLKMAGELCDGWITGSSDPAKFSEARDRVMGYSGGREMLFGHYLTVEEGKCSFEEARTRIEDLCAVGVTHFQVILRPDSENMEMLDECRDLIGAFE